MHAKHVHAESLCVTCLWLMKHTQNHAYVKTCMSWLTCVCIAMYTQVQFLHTLAWLQLLSTCTNIS